ncbi:MAG TPA: glycine cleavage T C-terminal barrel domain-containing protein, partial [Actinomycetota bacterium]|nr:glycine cleavage T C-terminal barrel domain-containing protein [Actinomycetota bacterium]
RHPSHGMRGRRSRWLPSASDVRGQQLRDDRAPGVAHVRVTTRTADAPTTADPELRRTPLEAEHVRLGGKLGPFASWLMPIEYGGALAEHRSVRTHVGLFDLTHLGKVEVAGPGALGMLQRLVTNDLSKADVGHALYNLVLNAGGGVIEDLIVYRLGEDRYFVVPNASNAPRVLRMLEEERADGPVHLMYHQDWCFLAVRDVLRLEMGYPLYGQDLFEASTAFEAGLGWAVAMDKGEFRGRLALLRQREEGLPSLLRGLRMHERRHIPRAHYPVFVGDQLVGEVTSGTFSPVLGTGIALAYVWPGDVVELGQEVEVDIRGRRGAATVVKPPFVDRSPR